MAEGISRQSLGISRIFSVQKQESPRAIWTASRKGQSQLGGGNNTALGCEEAGGSVPTLQMGKLQSREQERGPEALVSQGPH